MTSDGPRVIPAGPAGQRGPAYPALRTLACAILLLATAGSFSPAGEKPTKRRQVADFIGTTRAQETKQTSGTESDASPPAPSFIDPDAGGTLPLPIQDGLAWLGANQNPDGSWGSAFQLIVTSAVVETLAAVDLNSPALNDGAVWLAGQTPANHEFLARQVTALGGVQGFEATASSMAAQLLAARNPAEPDPALPNWPEGGWGIAPGFETDSLTTAWALLALDRMGFNGGFQVNNVALGPGATNVHSWVIAADAIKARIVIRVTGSTVRLRMKQGSPPTIFDPYFSLPAGPTFLITLPDSGLPFTPGTNFISIESPSPPALAATYTMTASYETPTFDTRMLAEPLAYLRASQNGDGGWGLQRGEPSEFYTTLHALLALLKYAAYDFAADIAEGMVHVRSQQNGDGSFGFGGPPIAYVTALAALDLVRTETCPFSADTEDAIGALLAMQSMDGSWDQEAYDTALSTRALWEHSLPFPGRVPDLDVTDVGGGGQLLFTWTNTTNASDYVVFQDTSPTGAFATMTGTAASGVTGLSVPTPPGNLVYFLVAGRNSSCGLGPKR